jgi:hypothetical protein
MPDVQDLVATIEAARPRSASHDLEVIAGRHGVVARSNSLHHSYPMASPDDWGRVVREYESDLASAHGWEMEESHSE